MTLKMTSGTPHNFSYEWLILSNAKTFLGEEVDVTINTEIDASGMRKATLLERSIAYKNDPRRRAVLTGRGPNEVEAMRDLHNQSATYVNHHVAYDGYNGRPGQKTFDLPALWRSDELPFADNYDSVSGASTSPAGSVVEESFDDCEVREGKIKVVKRGGSSPPVRYLDDQELHERFQKLEDFRDDKDQRTGLRPGPIPPVADPYYISKEEIAAFSSREAAKNEPMNATMRTYRVPHIRALQDRMIPPPPGHLERSPIHYASPARRESWDGPRFRSSSYSPMIRRMVPPGSTSRFVQLQIRWIGKFDHTREVLCEGSRASILSAARRIAAELVKSPIHYRVMPLEVSLTKIYRVSNCVDAAIDTVNCDLDATTDYSAFFAGPGVLHAQVDMKGEHIQRYD